MVLYMPDIRCRAKRIDNHEWIIGFLVEKTVNNEKECYIIPDTPFDSIKIDVHNLLQKMFRINRYTLGLSTGQKDVNGNLIFTGDILETTDHEDCLYVMPWRTLVLYDDDYKSFYGDGGEVKLDEDEFYFCKIVGNMYDDKDMLEDFEESEEE